MTPSRKNDRLNDSRSEELCFDTQSGPIRFSLLRSERRRTIEIRVTEREQVRVTAPVYASRDVIEQFLRERTDWIAARLKEARGANRFLSHRDYAHGQEFLFLGKHYPLHIQDGAGRRAVTAFDAEGWTITLPDGLTPPDRREKARECLLKWYKQQALEIFGGRVFHFARVMGLQPLEISVRTQKAVWGLCACQEKRISLNWLLVLAPVSVIDYVIVHEIAHLSHPNHSRRFWKAVEDILPDYQERQDWLKNHRLEMTLP